METPSHIAAVIVDDAPENLAIAKIIMHECLGDCPVYQARSMPEGLARVHEATSRSDIRDVYVLSDFNMGPEGSGADLCDAVRDLRLHVRLVIFTLSPDKARAELARRGFHDVPVVAKSGGDVFGDAARVELAFSEVGEMRKELVLVAQ